MAEATTLLIDRIVASVERNPEAAFIWNDPAGELLRNELK